MNNVYHLRWGEFGGFAKMVFIVQTRIIRLWAPLEQSSLPGTYLSFGPEECLTLQKCVIWILNESMKGYG